MKQFRLLFTIAMVGICSWQSAWAQDSEVKVEVSLPEQNSLSTEILKKVEDVKIVTKLKVTSGSLGEKDWETLQSMIALKTLDLENASAEAVPDYQFSGSSQNCPNLETVNLPSNLKSIGKEAFFNKHYLKTITVPSTIVTIGQSAFQYCSVLEQCDLSNCNLLKEIPSQCFQSCTNLSFEIPANVESIMSQAFYYCESFSSNLPSNLKVIESNAFAGAGMTGLDIVIPEGMAVNYGIFNISGIKSISLPTNCYRFGDYVSGCAGMTDMTLKSPTLLTDGSYNFSYGPKNVGNITLHVPSHLVDLYKTHTYWSTYKDVVAIEDPISSYVVQADLDLNYAMRMNGTPSLNYMFPNTNKSLSLKISGETAQTFNNFTAVMDISSYYSSSHYYTMILNECPSVTVEGDFKQRVKFRSTSWSFMCLPFDFKVGDVVAEEGQFAIRTYNGGLRNTQNKATDNWTNMGTDDVISAGTGFIVQTSKATWLTFKAVKDGANYAFKTSADVLKLPLALNNSNTEASAANTGWNMVGNPWMTYFNAHKINYTAPFCYYNTANSKYETVSISDDDYAIPPLQAIFVQCPVGVSTIDFPASGRQLTSEITDQNGARTRSASDRLLLDIQISGGEELNDKTRIVVNPRAKADYEIGRDASKFLSYETKCPQIYSLDAEETQYAINERPEGNGTVRLGVMLASDGVYEIAAIRNALDKVVLTDNETGIQTDLQAGCYIFEARQGTYEGRFTLAFGAGITGIQSLTEPTSMKCEVFTVDGRNVGGNTEGLRKGVYVIRKGNETKKVIIK